MKRIAGVIAATAGIEPASFRTFIPMLFLLSYVASVIIIWKGNYHIMPYIEEPSLAPLTLSAF